MHNEQIIFSYHQEKSGSKQMMGLKNWMQSQRKPGPSDPIPVGNQFSTQKIKTSPMQKDKPSIIFQTQMNNNHFKTPLNLTPGGGNTASTQVGISKLTQKVPSMSSMEFKSINNKNTVTGG